MALRVVVSLRARSDLLSIHSYLSERSPAAADRMLTRFSQRFNELREFPLLGPDRSEFGYSLRLGYDVREDGEGQRILTGVIVEKLTLTSCGVFEALTEGSTMPVAETRRHAGIVAWCGTHSAWCNGCDGTRTIL